MKCAYCQSDISAQAVVCAVCKRDLYLIKPLQERVFELEGRLATHRSTQSSSSDPINPVDHTGSAAQLAGDPRLQSPLSRWTIWTAALVALLAAHLIIVVILDAHIFWLRVATLFIPIPFSFAAGRVSRTSLYWNSFYSIAVAALAVLGMSAVVALNDSTSVVPQDRRTWIEMFQYGASIFCSFLTGLVLARAAWGAANSVPSRVMRASAWLLSAQKVTPELLQRKIETLQKILGGVTAICTTGAAIFTGLNNVVGR